MSTPPLTNVYQTCLRPQATFKTLPAVALQANPTPPDPSQTQTEPLPSDPIPRFLWLVEDITNIIIEYIVLFVGFCVLSNKTEPLHSNPNPEPLHGTPALRS